MYFKSLDMKRKLFMVGLILFISGSTYAQWSDTGNNETTGTLRIGSGISVSTKKLIIKANSTDAIGLLENINNFGTGLIISAAQDPLRVGSLGNHFGNYFIVRDNGNVGIGTTNPLSKFEVNGTSWLGGSTSVAGTVTANAYLTWSDQRFKKNISSDYTTYQQLYQIKIYQYQYKDFEPEKTRYGVIAQELKEILPDMVAGDDEKGLSVNYAEMIPLLIRAVQDQKQTIDILSNEVSSLKKELTKVQVENSIEIEQHEMVIYPNPSNSSVKISFNKNLKNSNSYIEVVNLNGEVIRNIPRRGGETIEISNDELQKGVYFVRYILDGELKETKRLLIEK
jgi:hypothetical protein